MHIIAGELKKKHLFHPSDSSIRPISSKLQEAIFDFSFIQGNIHDARVLDLFSGTGVLGLEALSRGARFCVFADRNLALTKKNICACHYEKKSSVIEGDWQNALMILERQDKTFSLIFVDPPYDFQNYDLIIERILEKELLETYGFICIKHSAEIAMKDTYKNLSIKRHKKYGNNALTFYERTSSL